MGDKIFLHPQHGLNPTISTCLICGKGKNMIVLMGNKFKGQAPMYTAFADDVEPCDECRKKYLEAGGVLMVEAEKDEKGHIHKTGALAVLKDEAFKRIFITDIPSRRICIAEPGLLSKIGAFARPEELEKKKEE